MSFLMGLTQMHDIAADYFTLAYATGLTGSANM